MNFRTAFNKVIDEELTVLDELERLQYKIKVMQIAAKMLDHCATLTNRNPLGAQDMCEEIVKDYTGERKKAIPNTEKLDVLELMIIKLGL